MFVVFTALIWYGSFNTVDTYEIKQENDVSYDQAVKRFGETDATVYRYTDIRDVTYVKRRTMIPMIFTRDTISKSKWKTVMVKKQ